MILYTIVLTSDVAGQVEAQLLATRQELDSMQGVIQTPVDAENLLSGLLDKMHRRFEGLVKGDYAVGDHDLQRIHVAPRVHKMLQEYQDQVIQHLYIAQSCS